MNATRKIWLEHLDKIARPILTQGAANKLPMIMSGYTTNRCAPLEAFARSFAGIAPWLDLQEVPTEEQALQAEYRQLVLTTLGHLSNPENPNKFYFSNIDGVGDQPLVDAAFLAHACLRSQQGIVANLDDTTRLNLIACLKETRSIIHHDNNWILFSAMVEAGLDVLGSDYDQLRIDYGIQLINTWYKGDGIYGDGPEYSNDYYNSFVIQPFMVDLIKRYPVIATNAKVYDKALPGKVMARATRYAQYQEMLINADGSYPVFGRSMCYRSGAFQHLAQAALQEFLPENVSLAQARCALTAVIEKVFSPASTFDEAGYLTVGVYGQQSAMGEPYINIGSCYLALEIMLPLGLPATHEFWASPDQAWTAKKIWSGEQTTRDSAYHEIPIH